MLISHQYSDREHTFILNGIMLNNERIDLNDLMVFVEVVRGRSFRRAAEVLGLPTSAVSRRVARLEKQLNLQLLHRTTRQVGLTDAGRVYFDHAAPIRQAMWDARQAALSLKD